MFEELRQCSDRLKATVSTLERGVSALERTAADSRALTDSLSAEQTYDLLQEKDFDTLHAARGQILNVQFDGYSSSARELLELEEKKRAALQQEVETLEAELRAEVKTSAEEERKRLRRDRLALEQRLARAQCEKAKAERDLAALETAASTAANAPADVTEEAVKQLEAEGEALEEELQKQRSVLAQHKAEAAQLRERRRAIDRAEQVKVDESFRAAHQARKAKLEAQVAELRSSLEGATAPAEVTQQKQRDLERAQVETEESRQEAQGARARTEKAIKELEQVLSSVSPSSSEGRAFAAAMVAFFGATTPPATASELVERAKAAGVVLDVSDARKAARLCGIDLV